MKEKKARSKWINYRIKMQLGVGGISFGIIIVFAFFIFYFLLGQLKQKDYNNALEILNAESSRVELFFSNVDSAAKRIATDRNLQNTILKYSSGNDYIQQQRIYESVIEQSKLFTETQGMNTYIYDGNNEIRFFSHDLSSNIWLTLNQDKMHAMENKYRKFIADNKNNKNYLGLNRISLVRRIYYPMEGISLGIVEISISRKDMEELLHEGQDRSIYLYDDEGNILYPFTSVSQEVKELISENKDQVKKDSGFITTETFGGTLNVAVHYENNSLYQTFNMWKQASILLIMMALLCTVFLMVVYTHILLKPLNSLKKDIEKIRLEDVEIKISTREYDEEFKSFVETLNEMLDRISLSKNKEMDAVRQTEKARYEALQAQISPHFIQNALFDLQIMITDGEQEAAHEMCAKLSFLLRYVMEMDDMNVPLSKELDYVRNYLDMHRLQYEDKLHYEIICPEKLREFQVPKISIQPFIENSIKHGFDKSIRLQTISIECMEQGGNIVILISDNGAGISEKQISAMLRSVEARTQFGIITGQDERIPGIGVVNTLCRWKYLYKNGVETSIRNLHPGTEVCIVVQENTHMISK